jgi:hypothetical protein
MENIDLNGILVSFVVTILVLKCIDAWHYFRQKNQSQPEEDTGNLVRCEVKYDPNDPSRKLLYVFDRDNNQFLTQAESIKQAVVNLVEQQKYTTITFHPDHCPPEVFEQTRQIIINDFAKVKQ